MTKILPSYIEGSIPRALDILESVAGTSNLDLMEIDTRYSHFCFGLAIPAAAVACYFSPFPFATAAIAAIGIGLGSYYDYVQAKKNLIERKIELILEGSPDLPKTALIIQSRFDPKGALSMRTHVENVRELAKTHRIYRVVVGNKREFLNSLPFGKFDVVWVRAHGTPNAIEMGSDFAIRKDSAPNLLANLTDRVKQGGTLILESCNTGNGEYSIAARIASACCEAAIYAPKTKISGILGFEFDKQGKPRFNEGFYLKGKNTTRIIYGPEASSYALKSYFYS